MARELPRHIIIYLYFKAIYVDQHAVTEGYKACSEVFPTLVELNRQNNYNWCHLWESNWPNTRQVPAHYRTHAIAGNDYMILTTSIMTSYDCKRAIACTIIATIQPWPYGIAIM